MEGDLDRAAAGAFADKEWHEKWGHDAWYGCLNAFLAGINHLRGQLLKDAGEFDETSVRAKAEAFADLLKRGNGLFEESEVKRFVPVIVDACRWQHEQSRLREARLKIMLNKAWKIGCKADEERDAALAEVERLEDLLESVHETTLEPDTRSRIVANMDPSPNGWKFRTSERDRLKAEVEHWRQKYGRYVDKWNEENALATRLKRELAEAKLIISGKTFDDELAAEREKVARLEAELKEANATCVKVSRLGDEAVTAERARAEKLVDAAEWVLANHFARTEFAESAKLREAIAAWWEGK